MLNAAIIGLGAWGQRLVRAIQGKSELIQVSRCVTRTIARAQEFADEFGLPIVSDLSLVLADPTVDAVIVATPHSQHTAQIEAAAAHGKHVFVEKPLALTRREVEAAAAACAAAGVVLAVGHNRRFLPSVGYVSELIRTQQLGRLLLLEGNFSGPSGWAHHASAWRADDKESPWGGMTGKGLHVSDLMILFAGKIAEVDARSVRRVFAALDDTTHMLLRFHSGAQGYLASVTATADLWRLQIFGDRGWAEMRGLNTLAISEIGQTERIVQFEPLDIERAELESFARAVLAGATYPVPIDEVANNIAFLEAIGRSLAESRSVLV